MVRRAVPRERPTLVMAALLVLLFLGPASMPAQDAGRSPESLALVAAAAGRAALGSWAETEALAGQAVDLDARDSDALYLSALAGLRLRAELRPPLEKLELATQSASFRLYKALDARDLRAGLLIRLRRYADALVLLPGPTAGQSSADILDPEYRRLRALAFLGLGRAGQALGELSAAAERFPSDPAFARIFFERFARNAPNDESRRLALVFLSRLDSLSALDPDLPILALPFILDQGKRTKAILARRALGGFPVSASLAALQYGIIGDKAAIAEVFASSPDLAFTDLEALRDLLGSAEGRAELAARLASFTGRISFDRDGDSWPEEEAMYKASVLMSWELDADQDGRFEASMDFSGGLPSRLSLALASSDLVFAYGDYPSVMSLRTAPRLPPPSELGAGAGPHGEASPRVDVYSFAPESLLYAPIELLAFPSSAEASIFLPRPTAQLPSSIRAAAGLALGLKGVAGKEGEVLSLERGLPLRRESYIEGRLVAVLDYQAGRPGIEKVDADLDGRFETERAYDPEGGAQAQDILWARIDADGDGIFEFREDFGQNPRKSWDFDQDGRMDAIEYSLPAGQKRREFSSRLDGRFDEILILDAQGRIASFTRDARPLALVQDGNPRLRWLGTKPFDLGGNLPGAEGIYTHMGLRYRLVYAGDSAFAEIIE